MHEMRTGIGDHLCQARFAGIEGRLALDHPRSKALYEGALGRVGVSWHHYIRGYGPP